MNRVISVLGQDRPGLVNEVSELVLACGGNVEDSRMSALRGTFAVLMLVTGSEESMAALDDKLAPFAESRGWSAAIRDTGGALEPADMTRFQLEVTGIDYPGIVRLVARALTAMETNIVSMETRLVPGPMSGAATFQLVAVVDAPPAARASSIEDVLSKLCEEENLDLKVSRQ